MVHTSEFSLRLALCSNYASIRPCMDPVTYPVRDAIELRVWNIVPHFIAGYREFVSGGQFQVIVSAHLNLLLLVWGRLMQILSSEITRTQ